MMSSFLKGALKAVRFGNDRTNEQSERAEEQSVVEDESPAKAAVDLR